MKATELVALIQAAIAEHGDMEIKTVDGEFEQPNDVGVVSLCPDWQCLLIDPPDWRTAEHVARKAGEHAEKVRQSKARLAGMEEKGIPQ